MSTTNPSTPTSVSDYDSHINGQNAWRMLELGTRKEECAREFLMGTITFLEFQRRIKNSDTLTRVEKFATIKAENIRLIRQLAEAQTLIRVQAEQLRIYARKEAERDGEDAVYPTSRL